MLHVERVPGRPLPQGEGQVGSPGLEAFHSAKSRGLRFSLVAKSASPSPASSSATEADEGLSLRYWCPATLPSTVPGLLLLFVCTGLFHLKMP